MSKSVRSIASVVKCGFMFRRSLVLMSMVTACAPQLEVQVELGAAKARLAALQAQRDALRAHQKELAATVATLKSEAESAETARRELRAAIEVLAGRPVPVEFQLHQALIARGDAAAIANATLLRPLTCDDTPASAAPEEQGEDVAPSCEPPPLDDACASVEKYLTPDWHFVCDKVISLGAKKAVVCRAHGEVPGVPEQVVRVASLHQGRIAIADWPTTDHDLRRPPNDEGQAACTAENEHNQCLRDCDVQFDKVSLPYDCGGHEGPSGYEGDGDGDGDGAEVEPEAPELQAARRELEAAEEQARVAAEARDSAAREVSYQECNTRCASPNEPPVAPPETTISLEYPAPGFLLITQSTPNEDGGASTTLTDLVRASSWLDSAPSDAGLDQLELLATYSTYTVSGPLIAGVASGMQVGFKISGAAYEELTPPQTCAVLEKSKLGRCDGGAW